MQTDRSIYHQLLESPNEFKDLETFTSKAKLLNAYLDEALNLELFVSPMALLDEFEAVQMHIEKLSAAHQGLSNELVKLSVKKMEQFEEVTYQIGPSLVELHGRIFPNPDPKERHHILKLASTLTKYDSLENRHFILEIKQIHDIHFKQTIKRDKFN